MLIAFLIQSVALVSVMALGSLSPTLFVISMALVFFTWGEVYVLFPSALADFFGGKNASANYSFYTRPKAWPRSWLAASPRSSSSPADPGDRLSTAVRCWR